ncbi:triose-phosphate isomerase [Proteobacteria bacterium 005FR1]|nr:triose-phosphate isomerase [Proteobacteria bacterium 005FR1]
MPRPLVVGNWKMNGSRRSTAELLEGLLQRWQGVHKAEVAVCAPFVYLAQVGRQLADSRIRYGAQDLSPHDDGAYTGDISAAMLSDMLCSFVIVGHSERRSIHRESNELVAEKAAAALAAGLTPIICVGESLEQRESNETLQVVEAQLKAVAERIGAERYASTVVAYEPVWAIGTGKTASPEQAQEVHSFIRRQLGANGADTPILYGGSVKPDNAEELFRQADIDGGLIGGASLDAEQFTQICEAADRIAD